MGEIADAMINGLLCEKCGGYIDGAEPGYPRKCVDCKRDAAMQKGRKRGRSGAKHKRYGG